MATLRGFVHLFAQRLHLAVVNNMERWMNRAWMWVDIDWVCPLPLEWDVLRFTSLVLRQPGPTSELSSNRIRSSNHKVIQICLSTDRSWVSLCRNSVGHKRLIAIGVTIYVLTHTDRECFVSIIVIHPWLMIAGLFGCSVGTRGQDVRQNNPNRYYCICLTIDWELVVLTFVSRCVFLFWKIDSIISMFLLRPASIIQVGMLAWLWLRLCIVDSDWYCLLSIMFRA